MSEKSIKKYIKDSLTIENLVFVIILGSIIFYLFFQVVILKTASPQVAVTTTSMVPTYQGFDLTEQGNIPTQYFDILRGDLLIVQNIQPHVGDVIVFDASHLVSSCRDVSQSVPIVHRIVAEKIVNGNYFYATKGDHNPTSDAGYNCIGNDFGWIPSSDVLGVVVFDIHYIGWFSLQLQNPFVRTLLIVAVLAIILLTVYDSFVKNDSSDKTPKPVVKPKIKRKVYLKYKKMTILINRSKLIASFFIILVFLTFFGVGFLNYSTGTNSVTWIRNSNEERNGMIDLTTNTEKYAVNSSDLYFYNYEIMINSSGSLNFVHKVTVTAVFHNFDATNPTYVWTIVYDYYGSKLIHSILLFELPQNTTGLLINTTLVYTVYSAGLLASAPITTDVNVTVVV